MYDYHLIMKRLPVTIDLPVISMSGHNFLDLNNSRLLVGSVSNFIFHKGKQKRLLFKSHLVKSNTLVSSSIQRDFCSFLSRERNADGIHQLWHNAIYANELTDIFYNGINELSDTVGYKCKLSSDNTAHPESLILRN